MSAHDTAASVAEQPQSGGRGHPRGRCTIEGCGRPHYGHGFCGRHYQRWRKYGRLTVLTDADRFWAGVDKDGPEHPVLGKCWVWTKADRGKGYGVLSINDREVATHRFAYVLLVGPIPNGLFVLHRCDNPSCVNPMHLYAGTHEQNMADKRVRGRAARGERNFNTKLTLGNVREIKRRLRDGGKANSPYAIAKDYGVWPNAITNIAKGRSWVHVE